MFGKLCAQLSFGFALLLIAAMCLVAGCAANRSIVVEKAGGIQADPVAPSPPPANVQAAEKHVVTEDRPHSFAPIMFDFDRYNVRDDQEFVLTQNVVVARAVPVIVLEGYCDERGTSEYNLALGQRRADTVRKALMQRGVSAELRTVSYGKERVTGHDEIGWAVDRRVELVRGQ